MSIKTKTNDMCYITTVNVEGKVCQKLQWIHSGKVLYIATSVVLSIDVINVLEKIL